MSTESVDMPAASVANLKLSAFIPLLTMHSLAFETALSMFETVQTCVTEPGIATGMLALSFCCGIMSMNLMSGEVLTSLRSFIWTSPTIPVLAAVLASGVAEAMAAGGEDRIGSETVTWGFTSVEDFVYMKIPAIKMKIAAAFMSWTI